jgi:hypothetical protein
MMERYALRIAAQKLGIREGTAAALIDPPRNYASVVGELPAGAGGDGWRRMALPYDSLVRTRRRGLPGGHAWDAQTGRAHETSPPGINGSGALYFPSRK